MVSTIFPTRQICAVEWLGRVEPLQAWELQERLADEIARGQRLPTLLLLEHPPTYTFGRRGRPEHLLWDATELKRRGIQVHWVDRGGDVTYHGPGQLVGYPLLPLGPIAQPAGQAAARVPQADYQGYLRKLEQVLILALEKLGFQGYSRAGLTGVWVTLPNSSQPAKIAAIGVKVDARGVTRHGFALNVNPDMEHWQGIIACGLANMPVTSLGALTETPPTMEAVCQSVTAAFGEVFQFETKFV